MSSEFIQKTVYFVRHGQSEDNPRPVYQSLESPLSDKGQDQAEKIADRATRISFEALISSPLVRAKETAEAIGKATGKIPEYSELFVERIKPSRLSGLSHDNENARQIWKEWNKSLYDSSLRVEDGENYDDIMSRADKALEFLKNRPEKEIFVVSHGFFLRTLIARVTLGLSMTADNLKNIQSTGVMKNTGLTVFQYGSMNENDAWRLWVYNDHTHLG